MRYLITIVHEVWHLFVDDALFAGAIVAWPALTWLAVRLGVPSILGPEVLSVGYGVILYLGAIDRAFRAKHRAGCEYAPANAFARFSASRRVSPHNPS